MKRLTFLLFTLLVLAAAGVSAFSLIPHGWGGHVYVKDVSEMPNTPVFTMTIKNLGSGEEVDVEADTKGYYQYDIGNFKEGFRDGDSILTKIKGCSDARCSQIVKVSGGRNIVDFYITKEVQIVVQDGGKEVIKEVQEIIETLYICWDGSKVSRAELCPVQPQPDPVVVEKEVIVNEEVVVYEVPLYAKIVIGALGIALGALGYLYYANKSKYKWVPGMSAIIKKIINETQEAYKKGDTKTADKKLKSLEKYSQTIVEKYVESEQKTLQK